MAFKQNNNPLSRKTSPINKNWIQGAIKRPGAFRKKAEEAGMSTKAFAEKVTSNKEDYSTRTGRQAELAETLMGMSRHESGHVNPEQGDFDYEDPNYRNTPEYKKFKRKQKRLERKKKGKDPDQEIVERDNDLSREANEDLGMSRKASPLNAEEPATEEVEETVINVERDRSSREAIKSHKAKDKNEGKKSKAEIRQRKTMDKVVKAKKATEKATDRESEKAARAKANRLQKRAARQGGRAERKYARKSGGTRGERRKAIIDSREKQKKAVKNIDKKSSPASRKASPLNTGDWSRFAEGQKFFNKKPVISKRTKEGISNFIKDDKVYGPATAARNVVKTVYKKGKELVKGAAKVGKKVGEAIKETSEAAQTGGPYKK